MGVIRSNIKTATYVVASCVAAGLAAAHQFEAALIAAALGANVVVLLDPRVRALLRGETR